MSVQFLLFVIAVLLFAIFWELCKINSRLKRTLVASAPTSEPARINEGVAAKVAN